MNRFTLSSSTLAVLSALAMCASVESLHAEEDPCTRFTWDVSRELSTMKQIPQALDAGSSNTVIPTLLLDKAYELKLLSQEVVKFAAPVGKPTLADGAQAGMVRFKTTQAGNYRVSMTSGHWIDMVNGTELVRSRDFQGQRGCERPHKIVEYTLPASGEFIVQFSGATEPKIVIAITAAPAPATK